VPTATYVPTDTAAQVTLLSGFCILDGYTIPFGDAQLDQLYSGHQDYVLRFARGAERVVRPSALLA
jgi:hypothetical protein